MKKKDIIVLFGCGFYQRKIIRKLKKKFFIVGIDENLSCYCRKKVDYFLNLKFINTKNIYKSLIIKKYHPSIIISPNSDKGFIAANKLKKRFNLQSVNSNAMRVFFNKIELKKFLKENDFNYSKTIIFGKKHNLNKFQSKIILKPLRSSGSRDVFLIKKKTLSKIKQFNSKFIIQNYIDGVEYAVDGVIFQKEIKKILISKKIKVKNVNTVSQTIMYKQNLLTKKNENLINNTIKEFLLKLNYKSGLFHIEIILNKNGVFIIDAAPRGPGFFVLEDYVSLVLKTDMVKKLIQLEKKEALYFNNELSSPGLVHFFTTKKGIFKRFNKVKGLANCKFEKFIKNNTKTDSVKADKDRLGSITILSKNNSDLLKKFNELKKKVKPIYL